MILASFSHQSNPLTPTEFPMQVNVLEAKNRLSELLRAVQRGEEVVIANRGKGLARLAPLPTTAVAEPAPPGQAAAFTDWLARNPWPRRGPSVQPSDTKRHTGIQRRIEELRTSWD
jgi:prevent-host-death family protein